VVDPVVTDEMVEAFKAAIAEERHGWLPYDDEIRTALGAALEHCLRQQIRSAEVEQTPEEVWEQVRQMARNAALRTAATDALRVVYWQLRERTSAFRSGGGNEPYALGLEEATAAIEERLNELEREADRG
jgi:hypothetical protein